VREGAVGLPVPDHSRLFRCTSAIRFQGTSADFRFDTGH
jgi:hypothetical protein